MDSKRSKVAALAAAIFLGAAAGATTATAQEPERDYLVHNGGKRPIFASELRRQQEAEKRKQMEQTARNARESRGTFIQQGKVVVWKEGGDQGTASSAVKPEPKKVESRGRFEQRGKAIFWVEDKK